MLNFDMNDSYPGWAVQTYLSSFSTPIEKLGQQQAFSGLRQGGTQTVVSMTGKIHQPALLRTFPYTIH